MTQGDPNSDQTVGDPSAFVTHLRVQFNRLRREWDELESGAPEAVAQAEVEELPDLLVASTEDSVPVPEFDSMTREELIEFERQRLEKIHETVKTVREQLDAIEAPDQPNVSEDIEQMQDIVASMDGPNETEDDTA